MAWCHEKNYLEHPVRFLCSHRIQTFMQSIPALGCSALLFPFSSRSSSATVITLHLYLTVIKPCALRLFHSHVTIFGLWVYQHAGHSQILSPKPVVSGACGSQGRDNLTKGQLYPLDKISWSRMSCSHHPQDLNHLKRVLYFALSGQIPQTLLKFKVT